MRCTAVIDIACLGTSCRTQGWTGAGRLDGHVPTGCAGVKVDPQTTELPAHGMHRNSPLLRNVLPAGGARQLQHQLRDGAAGSYVTTDTHLVPATAETWPWRTGTDVSAFFLHEALAPKRRSPGYPPGLLGLKAWTTTLIREASARSALPLGHPWQQSADGPSRWVIAHQLGTELEVFRPDPHPDPAVVRPHQVAKPIPVEITKGSQLEVGDIQ